MKQKRFPPEKTLQPISNAPKVHIC